jgi:hypothetical protein
LGEGEKLVFGALDHHFQPSEQFGVDGVVSRSERVARGRAGREQDREHADRRDRLGTAGFWPPASSTKHLWVPARRAG